MQVKITKRQIDALEPGAKDLFLWDTVLKGFGLKCTPKGKKVYVIQYRTSSRTPKRFFIGQHGTWTPETARTEAKRLLNDIAKGEDPSHVKAARKAAPTLTAFADTFLNDYAIPHKKASSVDEDRRNLQKHLLPAFGKKPVERITRADIAKLHQSLKDSPIAANRTLALISIILKKAEEWGVRPDGSNPCRHVKRFKEQARTRFMSGEELQRLGLALNRATRNGHHSLFVVNAFRLLLMTGARLNEILSLRWEYVDTTHSCLRLPDSKTGQKTVYLNTVALQILERLPRLKNNPYVLPGNKPGRHLVRIHAAWYRICKDAGISDLRIHDLRHSFASVGAGAGFGLPVIGALLGHTQAATTQRYAHLANDPLKHAADSIGLELSRKLEGKASEKKQPARRLKVVK